MILYFGIGLLLVIYIFRELKGSGYRDEIISKNGFLVWRISINIVFMGIILFWPLFLVYCFFNLYKGNI